MKKIISMIVLMMCVYCSVANAAESGKSFNQSSPYTSIADAYQVTQADYGKAMYYNTSKFTPIFLTMVAPSDGTFCIAVKPKAGSVGLYVYDRAQKQLLHRTVYKDGMYVYEYSARQYEKISIQLYCVSKNEGTFSICFDGYHVPGLFSEVTKEATCTESGIRSYPCELCDRPAKTEKIPTTGHQGTWQITKAASCTAAGEKTMTCAVCKQTVKEAIPATGHKPGDWITVQAATATEEGKQTQSCTVCGAKLNTRAIPKLAASAELTASATAMGNDGTFTVTLGLKNNTGIGYISIVSNAASKGITLENAQTTNIASGATATVGNKIVVFSSEEIAGNGSFLILTMKSSAKDETTLSFTADEAYGINEQTVAVAGVNVSIKKGGITGDCNGDGVVDGRDLLRLARYIAGGGSSVDLSAADINGDGNMDGRDVLRLAKQLAGS